MESQWPKTLVFPSGAEPATTHRLSEKVTLSDALPIVAVTFAIREEGILPVLAEKLMEDDPAGTTREVGTLSELLPDETVMAAPPEGAGPLSVMTHLLVP